VPTTPTKTPPPGSKPKCCVRVGKKGRNWNIPRRFSDYRIAKPDEKAVGGASPKWLLIHKRKSPSTTDFFLAKAPGQYGEVETYTELFINELGTRPGFPMAPAGLVRLDGRLHFLTRSFLKPGEVLAHGRAMLEEHFQPTDIAAIRKGRSEQDFYTLDFMETILEHFCDASFPEMRCAYFEMLIFDALVGSMDRHVENWGVILSSTTPRTYRFASIFDSARSLLWNYDEPRLEKLSAAHGFNGYINRAKPLIGIPGPLPRPSLNHFGLVQHLLERYPLIRSVKNGMILIDPFHRHLDDVFIDLFPQLTECVQSLLYIHHHGLNRFSA
jgi:hypothetical protein